MQFTVLSNRCLTEQCEDKSIFHLVLQPEFAESESEAETESAFDYQPGDWITLQAKNEPQLAEAVLQKLQLSGDESIELRRCGVVSVRDALIEHLEISLLNPAILNKLQRQYGFEEWADRQAMIDYAYGRDILDLLETYPSLCDLGVEFLSLLAPLGPRYYSIASAPVAVGNEVHLLIREVAYRNNASERIHYGVVSHAVSRLQTGDVIQGTLKPNSTFKLPQDPATPIIMLGAGTGLAPFIGFMQQRVADGATGNLLFFGETQQACAFLFEEQLAQWASQGQLQLIPAFSRDQAQKVYVQHRMLEQRQMLWQWVEQGAHIYLCGDQTGLAKGVEAAWLEIMQSEGGMDLEQAQQNWQAWRKARRLQTDLY